MKRFLVCSGIGLLLLPSLAWTAVIGGGASMGGGAILASASGGSAPSAATSLGSTVTSSSITPTWTNGTGSTRGTEYGLTASYGTSGPSTSGTAITGLTASTTYHWREWEANAYGTTYTADQTATTSDSGITATLYVNANSATTGQAPASYGKGTGNLTVGANVTTTAGIVGNALLSNNTSGSLVNISSTSNINFQIGTCSFYFRPNHVAGQYWSVDGLSSGSTGLLHIENYGGTASGYGFVSQNAVITSVLWPTITDNHWIWVSVSWDVANNRAAYRLYDQTSTTWLTSGGTSAWVDITGLAGAAATDTDIIWGTFTASLNTAYDQMVITGGFRDDVFTSRDNTAGW